MVTTYPITGQTAEATNIWTVVAYNGIGDSVASAGKSVTQNVAVSVHITTTVGDASAANACSNTTTHTKYKTGVAGTVSMNDQFYEDSDAVTFFDGNGTTGYF